MADFRTGAKKVSNKPGISYARAKRSRKEKKKKNPVTYQKEQEPA